ncbi:MAG: TVP38/TMEM64 family protein [Candidatus Hermodarchaeota archaeon]
MEDSKKEDSFSIKFKRYLKNLFDFSQYSVLTTIFIILFVALIILSLFILYYNYFIDTTFVYTIVAEWFVNPIWALGYLGILLFIVIMAIQGLIVPIPSEVVLLATGMIWGWLFGGIMGIIGSMAASLLCFYISRRGGRPLAKKFVGESGLAMADKLINKYGIKAIIVSRFIPFISFDVISYASGLIDIDIKKYSIGTLIGSIFRAFFYSIWGALLGFNPPINTNDVELIRTQSEVFNVILLVVLAILILMFLLYYLISKHYEKKNQ